MLITYPTLRYINAVNTVSMVAIVKLVLHHMIYSMHEGCELDLDPKMQKSLKICSLL